MKKYSIGIICAMKEELEPFKSEVAACSKPPLLFYSGVGKVNAAMSAERLIARGVKAIIVSGVAGGLDPSLKIGDIVLATDALEHDVDASSLGFKRGEIPFMEYSCWESDKVLMRAAGEAAEKLGRSVHRGRCLSGDRFIADRKEAQQLREAFQGACTDMETAAIAHVCFAYQIPWLAVRVISDAANEESPKDFPAFLKEASAQAAELIANMGFFQKDAWPGIDNVFETFLEEVTRNLNGQGRKNVQEMARFDYYGRHYEKLFEADVEGNVMPSFEPMRRNYTMSPRYPLEEMDKASDLVESFEKLHPDRIATYYSLITDDDSVDDSDV